VSPFRGSGGQKKREEVLPQDTDRAGVSKKAGAGFLFGDRSSTGITGMGHMKYCSARRCKMRGGNEVVC